MYPVAAELSLSVATRSAPLPDFRMPLRMPTKTIAVVRAASPGG